MGINDRVKNKLVIPDNFTIVQSLKLLYLIIANQLDNVKLRYQECTSLKEVGNLIKCLNYLLDDFYDGVKQIEGYYKFEKILNLNSWKDEKAIRLIQDYFLLDQELRMARNKAKSYVVDNKGQNGFAQIFNSSSSVLNVNRNKVKHEEEEEMYVYRKAEQIKLLRDSEKQNLIAEEKQKQAHLEKRIETKVRKELVTEFEKKLEEDLKLHIDSMNAEIDVIKAECDAMKTERDVMKAERDAMKVERDAMKVERDAAMQLSKSNGISNIQSKKTANTNIYDSNNGNDSNNASNGYNGKNSNNAINSIAENGVTNKSNTSKIGNLKVETKNVQRIPASYVGPELRSPRVNMRRSFDSHRGSRYIAESPYGQRTSFDIQDIGRAAMLAWTGSQKTDSLAPLAEPHSLKKSKSDETIKKLADTTTSNISRRSTTSRKTKLSISRQAGADSSKNSRIKNNASVKSKNASSSKSSVSTPLVASSPDLESPRNASIGPHTVESRIDEVMNSLHAVDESFCKQIVQDILVTDDIVRWDEIAGLNNAKEILKETVEYPFLRPDLFKGLREPIRGLLLFGPPGTGKTMIAKAVAYESNSTFFSISASSLLSKYLGESEKLIRALFYLAKRLAPSIIFIDEIDSLLTARADNENEASRRIKTELLIQWSILSNATSNPENNNEDNRVLLLSATNLPWAIDEAARRRFSKRLYIPLPEFETRLYQLKKLLSAQKNELSDEDFDNIATMTEGYSGSDITALAKDAAMQPIRELGANLLAATSENIRPVTFEDLCNAMKTIKRSVSIKSISEYDLWSSQFGSSGV